MWAKRHVATIMFARFAVMVALMTVQRLEAEASSATSQRSHGVTQPSTLGGAGGGGGHEPPPIATTTTTAICEDRFRTGGKLAYTSKKTRDTQFFQNCKDVATPQEGLPNGICNKLTGANGRSFQYWCYKTCTRCDDNDDIEMLTTTVRAVRSTTLPTPAKPLTTLAGRPQAPMSTSCPTTREQGGLCVNQAEDACHAHKCSIDPSCRCHTWEKKLNVSGTNGVNCYVCIDPPPPAPPHSRTTTKVDMNAIWAALGGGIVLLVVIVILVWYREKKTVARRRRRSRQMGGGGGRRGDGNDDDDDVAMLIPDANAEADSLEEAIKLLPWLADAEQKRAGFGEDDDGGSGGGAAAFSPSQPESSMFHNPSGVPTARVTERAPSPAPATQQQGQPYGGVRLTCSCVNPKASKARFCPTCGGVAVVVAGRQSEI